MKPGESLTTDTTLTGNSQGFWGWLARLFASKELDALRARLAASEKTLELERGETANHRSMLLRQSETLQRELETARAAVVAASENTVASTAPPIVDEEALLAPLRLELAERMREQSELETTVARKERERREVSTKLAKAQLDNDGLTKRLSMMESALHEAKRLGRRVNELEQLLEAKSIEIGSSDARITSLEDQLVGAMAMTSDEVLALAARDRDALIEELHAALASMRRLPTT